MFHWDLTQFKNKASVRVPLPSHVHNNNMDTDSSSCSMASLQLAGHVTSGNGGTCVTSDTGSQDSHNDYGYSTRLGISDPASPSLSVTDSEPLVDLHVIYMIRIHLSTTINNNFRQKTQVSVK